MFVSQKTGGSRDDVVGGWWELEHALRRIRLWRLPLAANEPDVVVDGVLALARRMLAIRGSTCCLKNLFMKCVVCFV